MAKLSDLFGRKSGEADKFPSRLGDKRGNGDGDGVKALAKAEARPGIWLVDAPEPEVGINDVLIRVLRTEFYQIERKATTLEAESERLREDLELSRESNRGLESTRLELSNDISTLSLIHI